MLNYLLRDMKTRRSYTTDIDELERLDRWINTLEIEKTMSCVSWAKIVGRFPNL